jgi:hypothetical protein
MIGRARLMAINFDRRNAGSIALSFNPERLEKICPRQFGHDETITAPARKVPPGRAEHCAVDEGKDLDSFHRWFKSVPRAERKRVISLGKFSRSNYFKKMLTPS